MTITVAGASVARSGRFEAVVTVATSTASSSSSESFLSSAMLEEWGGRCAQRFRRCGTGRDHRHYHPERPEPFHRVPPHHSASRQLPAPYDNPRPANRKPQFAPEVKTRRI
jgi:hypothetical protein